MQDAVFARRTNSCDNGFSFRLALIWFSGLFFGILFAYLDVPLFTSLMRLALNKPVTIVGSFVCILLPLICSAIFIAIGRIGYIFPICFLKAAAFGFCGSLLYFMFHSAAWLAVILLLFSDCFFSGFLFLFWLRSNQSREGFDTWLYRCFTVGVLIGGVDLVAIQPVLQRVF